ncbi:MAG: DUF4097 family beta strand repeat-containing protein [candidate division Zixibacteria bacterium]
MIIISVLAIFAISSTARADKEYTFDKDLKFDGNAVASLRIDMPSGDIKIERSSGSEITLEFKNVVYADSKSKAEDINDDCEYDAKLVGDEIDIRVDLPKRRHKRDFLGKLFSGNWNDNTHIFLRVSIPDGKSVEIDASSTDIEISDIKIDLDVRGSSSDIEMRDTEGNVFCDLSSGDVEIFRHKGNARIKGNSSDVRIDGVDGDIDIRTSSGDGRLDEISGSALISTSSGDYRIFSVGGNLDIKSSSGDILVDGVAGSAYAESSSGDVRLSALSAEQGDFEVDTVSGDVSVEISSEFTGRLSLRSNSGDISSRVSGDLETVSDSRLVANVGDGSGRLKVVTSSGDIRVTRY